MRHRNCLLVFLCTRACLCVCVCICGQPCVSRAWMHMCVCVHACACLFSRTHKRRCQQKKKKPENSKKQPTTEPRPVRGPSHTAGEWEGGFRFRWARSCQPGGPVPQSEEWKNWHCTAGAFRLHGGLRNRSLFHLRGVPWGKGCLPKAGTPPPRQQGGSVLDPVPGFPF